MWNVNFQLEGEFTGCPLIYVITIYLVQIALSSFTKNPISYDSFEYAGNQLKGLVHLIYKQNKKAVFSHTGKAGGVLQSPLSLIH